MVCPGGAWNSNSRPVRMCCLNGTNPDPITGRCQPGLYVPQPWYLNYLATGSNPCPFPYTWCSFYEFTIRGEERFGRGTLRQRITLPAGSNFPSVRITKGARHCPASAWSCRKAGDAVTCSTDNCGLGAGDEVVLRIEGKVAPDQTAPLSTAVERTACGVLESEPMPGRGPATIVEPDEFRRAQAAYQRPDTPSRTGDAIRPGSASREACWTIVLLPRAPDTPVCAAGYAATADGQCCFARQMTSHGVCCPPGQRPDAQRASCIPACPPDRVWTGAACACPPGTVERRGQCIRRIIPEVPLVTPEQTCGPDQTGVWPNCCPRGLYWNGRRCVPVSVRECPPDSIGKPPYCRCRPPLVGTPGSCRRPECPPGTTGTPPKCRPIVSPCPPDSIGKPPYCRCRPPLVGTPGSCTRPECPPGTTGTPPKCRPIVQRCPEGMVGRPPNCRPIVQRCPEGMVGRPPNCRPIVQRCPEGMVGRPPNCRPIVQRCPEGMVGRPPNCRPIVQRCPEGMVGRPPNCRPILRRCPEGMVGRPPMCRPKRVTLPDRGQPQPGQGRPPRDLPGPR
jgi:hypothetical protein